MLWHLIYNSLFVDSKIAYYVGKPQITVPIFQLQNTQLFSSPHPMGAKAFFPTVYRKLRQLYVNTAYCHS